jgi:hypothetical protein
VYTGVPITHESLCHVDQPSLLRNLNETSKAPLLSDREVAHVQTLLRWPVQEGGLLPSHIALMDLFEVERSYRGGLSIDCPFEGDNILLMPRVLQQGHSSTTQKDGRPPQFTLMDLPNEELGKCFMSDRPEKIMSSDMPISPKWKTNPGRVLLGSKMSLAMLCKQATLWVEATVRSFGQERCRRQLWG